MLASSYPLLDVFLTMLWFFLFFIYIWVLIVVLTDLFRSPDLSGWAKAGWFAFIIFLPILGLLGYLIARGQKMQEHTAEASRRSQQQMDRYIRQTARGPSTADELKHLVDLRDSGAISETEYERAKAKILS